MLIDFLWPEINNQDRAREILYRAWIVPSVYVLFLLIGTVGLLLDLSDPLFDKPDFQVLIRPFLMTFFATVFTVFLIKTESILFALLLLSLNFGMGYGTFSVPSYTAMVGTLIISVSVLRAVLYIRKNGE